ncbi:DUF4846 domain-containing protein [Emticicia sp. C21]|uniref:DUF4846 domain-containing protein n=1 Tax=Emticicia sp. C21 TaxID=2302915 RepID=UPI000E3566D1|nr:DUF4846 domain-containing protein [Emticicia sp. C21]RFS14236.1 hypothetical protein D0T08_22100 [Emticicia sp. C21]
MKTLVNTGCIALLLLAFICCTQSVNYTLTVNPLINESGTSVLSRFNIPKGYERRAVKQASFAHYLQNLPLKAAGSKVKYYDGSIKYKDVYEAVVNIDIDNKNLQQCADAIMRLRAEYFYAQKSYNNISFNLTNGFLVDYTEWIKGNRVILKGNQTYWQKSAAPSNTYKDFRNYMNFVFVYAGTLSLEKTLYRKEFENIAIGDVFIIGGSPGHAVIVVDVAENQKREKVFLLAQSYMPAQEIQILKNPNNKQLSPWYSANIINELVTPEWAFRTHHLRSWEK